MSKIYHRAESRNLNYTEYLLAEMRCAALRARIVAHDIDAIGVALKGGLVTADQAVDLLTECDAIRLVMPTPPSAEVSA